MSATCLYHLSHHPCLRIGGTRRETAREENGAGRKMLHAMLYVGVTRLFPSSFSHPPSRRTLGPPSVPLLLLAQLMRENVQRIIATAACHGQKRECVPLRSITIRRSCSNLEWIERGGRWIRAEVDFWERGRGRAR